MKAILALVLSLMPTLIWGHSMAPGFEVEQALTLTHQKVYTLTNDYPHPATYKVEVFNKDMSPADGYKINKSTYKLLPNSEREVKIKFKAQGQRKLIVCSTLTGIGKQDEKVGIISVVCSRYILNGISK